MTEVTRHEPGSFCWAELATSDPDAAKRFYTSLFGWTYSDSPMGPGAEEIYTRLLLRGKDVGALYRMMKEQRAQGVPPHWLCYVSVRSADETAGRAKALGATVIAEPFDVMTYGRMAMLQDPVEAMFAIWQPGTHIGAQVVNEPGALSWCELVARDTEKAGKFYAGLFGWGLKTRGDFPYTEFKLGEASIGGMYAPGPEAGSVPPSWMIYFRVADCDAAVERAKTLGGKLAVEPKDIATVGRFAVIQDPQGARFSIIKLV